MSTHKPDCSRHSKQVGGFTDMKLLAEAIGDLHYETLSEFLSELCQKISNDAVKDSKESRVGLAIELKNASHYIGMAHAKIKAAWKISKPFMDKPNTQIYE